jgi:integrase
MTRPKIKLLDEDNVRQGFFEPEQFESVLKHLPEDLHPVVTFAYITGWRVKSEALPLEWRQVDLKAGIMRLEPGTTKNKEGRTFPLTKKLRELLQAQWVEHEKLKKRPVPINFKWVFFRMVATKRRAPLSPHPIKSFGKAFKTACKHAGCPGRICTISGGRPSGTSSGKASRAVARCALWGTRPSPCTAAIRLSMSVICAKPSNALMPQP